MPIFEYKCEKCDKEFELMHLSKQSEKDAACPACGSKSITKKLSTFAPSIPGGASGGSMPPMGGCAGGSCGTGMCGLN